MLLRPSARPYAYAISSSLSFFLLTAASAQESLLLDDQPFIELYSAEVSGFRAFPAAKIVFNPETIKSTFSISTDVFAEAFAVTRDSPPGERPERLMIVSADDEQAVMAFWKSALPDSGQYDPDFLIAAYDSELVDADQRRLFPRSYWESSEWVEDSVELDSNVALDIMLAYSNLNEMQLFRPELAASTFATTSQQLAKYPEFYERAKIALAEVSVGLPIILPPQAAGITIPVGLDEYDIRLVVFSVNIKEKLAFVENVRLIVSLPENSVAFDLLPLRFENKEDEQTGLITELSSLFGGSVSSSEMQPIVVAYGLQDKSFGWELREAAIGFGAKRMIALLGVPKGSSDVRMETSVGVATKRESWVVEGHVAFSEPRAHVLFTAQ